MFESTGSCIAADRRHIWHPFTQSQTAPDPVEIVAAAGLDLIGRDGRRYWDLISSWWVNLHGHCHPALTHAIAEQAAQLEQVIFAGFTHPPAATLATRLTAELPEDLKRLFFSDDGSTAIEVALKMAIQFWINLQQPRSRFLAFEGGYHGDTAAAMSVGRASGFFEPYHKMLFQVTALPYPATWSGDAEVELREAAALAALDRYLERYGHETAALIIEPLIQGAGGMRFCRPLFLQQLQVRLQSYGVLLIFDEVMTGFGRTGQLFASRTAQVTPDILCLSKGITGGTLPLAVTICRDRLYEAFLGESFAQALTHGHSYTANPIACAVANASLDLLLQPTTAAQWQLINQIHQQRLARLERYPFVQQTRHCGTVAAFQLQTEEGEGYHATVGGWFKQRALALGLVLRPLGNVFYLMPPYCITADQLQQSYDRMEQMLQEWSAL